VDTAVIDITVVETTNPWLLIMLKKVRKGYGKGCKKPVLKS
jgi:hypothetical protein